MISITKCDRYSKLVGIEYVGGGINVQIVRVRESLITVFHL